MPVARATNFAYACICYQAFLCGLQYCIFAFASQLLLYVPAGHIGDIRVFRRLSVSWHMARRPAINSRLPAFALAALGYCPLRFALALAL